MRCSTSAGAISHWPRWIRSWRRCCPIEGAGEACGPPLSADDHRRSDQVIFAGGVEHAGQTGEYLPHGGALGRNHHDGEGSGGDLISERIPDETTILAFRHLLERHDLGKQIFETVKAHLKANGMAMKQGTIIDATLIAAPSSTKNKKGKRDPEMHQTKKGNQWSYGMKVHIGVDKDNGLIDSVETTAANVHDLTPAAELLHGE